MVIFHSYVQLPEGRKIIIFPALVPSGFGSFLFQAKPLGCALVGLEVAGYLIIFPFFQVWWPPVSELFERFDILKALKLPGKFLEVPLCLTIPWDVFMIVWCRFCLEMVMIVWVVDVFAKGALHPTWQVPNLCIISSGNDQHSYGKWWFRVDFISY